MKTILRLPYPPTINNYYCSIGNRRYVSEKGGKYKTAVLAKRLEDINWSIKTKVKDVRKRAPLSEYEYTGKIDVKVDLFVPDRRIRDVDNVLKPLLDSLVYARYIKDDSQVYSLFIEKHAFNPENKDFVMVYIEDIK